MNFDHWKDVETATGAIPVDRAYLKYPAGNRGAGKHRTKAVRIVVNARPATTGPVNSHFVASDHGPDMDLTLAERNEGVTETV